MLRVRRKGVARRGKLAARPLPETQGTGTANYVRKSRQSRFVPELRRVVDIVNVSLNAENAEVWRKIVRPAEGYEDGYDAVREFIRLCAAAGFDRVVASCVDRTGADAEAVKKIAEADGAQFYLRSFLDAQN